MEPGRKPSTAGPTTGARSHLLCEDPLITPSRDTRPAEITEGRAEKLLVDAGDFFESYLWESASSRAARGVLADEDLDEDMIRAFGVGYAPIGPKELMEHLRGLGYSPDELIDAGLATRSVRGRAHARFRSRIMFPVRDNEGRIRGFAGRGTHLGPSWSLWVTSPATELYVPSAAVFALDRAADEIAASSTAVVQPDSIEVLKAHQHGKTNAVTVHTNRVTRDQMQALAAVVPGGIDALELDLPPGMRADSKREPANEKPVDRRPRSGDRVVPPRPRNLNLKRLAIVIATAVATVNVWTGAPLLAVWIGSQVQPGRLLSYRAVVTVVVVLAVLTFLLGWVLVWLSAKYDKLTGRPPEAGQTSPWHRAKRGDRVQDIRLRYGVSAPEKAVAACVVAGVLVFELWFFFFAGSSLPSS